jgi:hypothetical protein
MKYIHHHLGLGDHIICNGLVRYFYKKYKNILLFCYPHNYENVHYMYRDLNNLEIINFDSERDADIFVDNNKVVRDNLIKPTFSTLDSRFSGMTFDESFYSQVGLNFNVRFDDFYFVRDIEKENEVCQKLNPNGEKYIFVLDDPKRDYNIDMNKITKKYKVIYNDLEFRMFDYIKFLENAEEIHTMQTGFLDLINSYKMEKPKIYRHNYVRNYPESIYSKGLNAIIEVD